MNAEDGVRNTLARYSHYCDARRFDEWIGLFRSDARYVVPGKTYEGTDDIRAFIEKAQPEGMSSKHLCLNTAIDLDGDRARARSDFVLLKDYAIALLGEYEDSLLYDANTRTWQFEERRLSIVRRPKPTDVETVSS